MAIARRLPHSRITALRLAIANIHRPGALTPTIVLSLGPRPRAARHRDRDRRQPAPAVHGGAAGQGAVVLLRRHPVGRRRALRRLHPRARAAGQARARADAARPHRRGQRRQGRGPQGRRPAPPGCCRATAASPTPASCRPARGSPAANGGAPDYQGPPLVSFEKKIADGLSLKIGDPITVNVLGRNITARGRQPAQRRLAEPRHQLRAGVLARHVRRRAAHPHRHADLSGRRRHARAGDRADQGGGRRVSRRHHGAGEGRARRGRRHRAQPGAGGARRQRASRWSRRCWCWAARSPPAIATGSTTRWCSRRSARRAAG